MTNRLQRRWSDAWARAKPETRTIVAGLTKRLGLRRLIDLGTEAAEVVKTYAAGPSNAVARTLVMRAARRFKVELSVQEADAIADFLLSTESDS